MNSHLIILIEDDPDLRNLLTLALPFFGSFQVKAAEDGIQGLQMCTDHHPNCVVLDVKMPGLDGYQVARALRGDPDTAEIPLIILTALAQDRDVFEGLSSGADRYLQKPIGAKELASVIHEVLTVTGEERMTKYQEFADKGGTYE